MITGFKNKETEKIWQGLFSGHFPNEIQSVARRKLRMLNNARSLNDLKIPPANRLEALRVTRKGQQSIRINGQWRICFLWDEGNAEAVEIVDYH